MARRAASISRAVMRARSVALSPYSPNATVLPRCALPAIRPLNCLRNLVRFGCIIALTLISSRDRRGCRLGRLRGSSLGFRLRHFGLGLVEHLALEYPHLDADHAIGRLRLGEPIVDVGAEGVQRHAPLAVALGGCDLRAVQAARDAHLDAERTRAHGVGDRALHRPSKHDALLELLRDALRDELRVELGLADLGDIQAHVLHRHAEDLRDLAAQLLDVLALLADHDAGTCRMNRDVGAPGGALDVDAADRGVGELLLQELPHQMIGVNVRGEGLGARIPLGGPVTGDAETNADRIDFLTHQDSRLPSETCTRMWLLRLAMRTPRPLARAWKRLSIGAASTSTRVTLRSSTSALKLL